MTLMKRTIGLAIGTAILAMIAGPLTAGVNWWTSRGPQGGKVTAFVSRDSEPQVLYAAVFGAGMFKTTDGGQTWRSANDGLEDRLITAAVARQDAAATLYAGTSRGAVFRSRDQGEHWIQVTSASGPIVSVVADSTSGMVYATTRDRLLRSDDDGTTWQTLALAGPPGNGTIISMNGTAYALSNSTLSASKDGGTTWLPQRLPIDAVSLAADRGGTTLVVANSKLVAQSSDGGASWKLLPVMTEPNAAIESVLTTGRLVVVGTTAGVFRSDDGGSWKSVGTVLSGVDVAVLAGVGGTVSQLIAFATSAGGRVYSMSNAGSEWAAVDLELRSAYTTDVAVGGTTVYAASSRLSKLTGSADSWEAIDDQLLTQGVREVAASGSGTVIVATGRGIEKSDDSGATWQGVTPGKTASAFAIAPSDAATMYAALSDAMSKSVDGGKTWKTIDVPTPYGYYMGFYGFVASVVAVDPADANTVFVSTDTLYKTSDGGTHWRALRGPVSAVAIDYFDRTLVYCATWQGKICRSTTSGGIWTTLENIDDYVSTLVADPARASVVYAGTAGGDVYRSIDAGSHWAVFNLGLTGNPIFKLAIDASGDRLYAATSGGVFEYQIDTAYLSGAATASVSLRTFYSNYVSADDCGDSRVSANATSAGACETFTLYDVNGGKLQNGDQVYLQAANGDFWSAENGGSSSCGGCKSPVVANRAVAASWETFTIHKVGGIDSIIRDGDSISLQSSAGDYVVADNGGSNGCTCDSGVNANRPVAHEWETFVIRIR